MENNKTITANPTSETQVESARSIFAPGTVIFRVCTPPSLDSILENLKFCPKSGNLDERIQPEEIIALRLEKQIVREGNKIISPMIKHPVPVMFLPLRVDKVGMKIFRHDQPKHPHDNDQPKRPVDNITRNAQGVAIASHYLVWGQLMADTNSGTLRPEFQHDAGCAVLTEGTICAMHYIIYAERPGHPSEQKAKLVYYHTRAGKHYQLYSNLGLKLLIGNPFGSIIEALDQGQQ